MKRGTVSAVTECTVGACAHNTPDYEVSQEKRGKTGNKADNKHRTLLVGIP